MTATDRRADRGDRPDDHGPQPRGDGADGRQQALLDAPMARTCGRLRLHTQAGYHKQLPPSSNPGVPAGWAARSCSQVLVSPGASLARGCGLFELTRQQRPMETHESWGGAPPQCLSQLRPRAPCTYKTRRRRQLCARSGGCVRCVCTAVRGDALDRRPGAARARAGGVSHPLRSRDPFFTHTRAPAICE